MSDVFIRLLPFDVGDLYRSVVIRRITFIILCSGPIHAPFLSGELFNAFAATEGASFGKRLEWLLLHYQGLGFVASELELEKLPV